MTAQRGWVAVLDQRTARIRDKRRAEGRCPECGAHGTEGDECRRCRCDLDDAS